MELFVTLAACASLGAASIPNDYDCNAATSEYQNKLKSIELTTEDRHAIARVSFAEAANQGDSGLAGVAYTIINRLISGQWGNTVTAVVNAPHQFEPVQRVGGWKKLPPLSPTQQARIDTIINLAMEGRLPDITNGALFFQNPDVVAQRESTGKVTASLTHFGKSTPSAVIQDHTFYAAINSDDNSKNPSPIRLQAERRQETKEWDIYGKTKVSEMNQSWDVFTNNSFLIDSKKEAQ